MKLKTHVSAYLSNPFTKYTIRFLLVLTGWLAMHSAFGQKTDLNFQVWVKTTVQDTQFLSVVSNKDWSSGKIVDYTTNSHFGKSRSSGYQLGWAIALQPNGSWTWNIGDGKKRLDYLPTAARQPLNDGKWHYLAFSLKAEKRTVWLYFDGVLVAIYSLDELNEKVLDSNAWRNPQITTSSFEINRMELRKGHLTPEKVKAKWLEKYPRRSRHFYPKQKQSTFNVMAWNIWHGGRRDGIVEGLARTVDILRSNKTDIICMQETYGSGPIIADRLKMIYYYRSTNLSVMSRYPIIDTHGTYDAFRLGGVTLQMPNGQKLRAFSLWINSSPNICEVIPKSDTPEQILKPERTTREKEIGEIIESLDSLLAQRDSIPMIVAGDYNSPSHLDWIAANKARNRGLIVPWPVSMLMTNTGFKDAFRLIYPDPVTHPGHTWSPKFKDQWQDRIDYIYFDGKGLECLEAEKLDQYDPMWPSDHGAVWGKFQYKME